MIDEDRHLGVAHRRMEGDVGGERDEPHRQEHDRAGRRQPAPRRREHRSLRLRVRAGGGHRAPQGGGRHPVLEGGTLPAAREPWAAEALDALGGEFVADPVETVTRRASHELDRGRVCLDQRAHRLRMEHARAGDRDDLGVRHRPAEPDVAFARDHDGDPRDVRREGRGGAGQLDGAERAGADADAAPDAPVFREHRHRPPAPFLHRERHVGAVDHAQLAPRAILLDDPHHRRPPGTQRPRERRHPGEHHRADREHRPRRRRQQGWQEEHHERVERHVSDEAGGVRRREHPHRQGDGDHHERPAHRPHPRPGRQPPVPGAPQVSPQEPSDHGGEQQMGGPDREEDRPSAVGRPTGEPVHHQPRARTERLEERGGRLGERLGALVPDQPVAGHPGQPDGEEGRHAGEPPPPAGPREPGHDEHPPGVDDGREDEGRRRVAVDPPHHPLDRMRLELRHRPVRRLESELEEEGDVDPGEDHHGQQEDGDGAGVGEGRQAVGADRPPDDPLDAERRPLQTAQDAPEADRRSVRLRAPGSPFAHPPPVTRAGIPAR